MSENDLRTVELVRDSRLQFTATNVRGGRLSFGSGDEGEFSPVELLLVAAAGCTAMDVDAITAKRAEPGQFSVRAEATKVRDGNGNHLTDLLIDLDVSFPDDEGGRAAEAVLEIAIKKSHERLCTVSRTIQLSAPVRVRLRGTDIE